jgi:hypothetical protein
VVAEAAVGQDGHPAAGRDDLRQAPQIYSQHVVPTWDPNGRVFVLDAMIARSKQAVRVGCRHKIRTYA